MNKKLIFLALALLLFYPTISSAESALSEPSVCCEKTEDGAWCINSVESECNDNYKTSPTSCETTSYCKLGTCYNSESGICMENTPQRVCEAEGGTWDERELEQVPQCQLGCCIIADQAAFVPLTRCKRLSSLFGVENNYRTDIFSEVECIAAAQSQDVGACVYEKDFERVCEFTTREECGAGQSVETIEEDSTVALSSERKFYKDYLCSAGELATSCAKQAGTECYQGKVYWIDSCGNRENVYSTDKIKSWNGGRVAEPAEICSPNDGSDNTCGNCEYLLGSRCAEWDGFLGIGKPQDADHYCQKTECVDRNGDKRMNGESWCVYDSAVGNGADLVGSRYYKETCIDGEVRVEPCADYRNEVCLQDTVETDLGDFQTAACTANRWQTCWQIDNEEDCLNIDRFDCMWLPPVSGMILGAYSGSGTTYSNPTSSSSSFSNPTFTGNVVAPITGNAFLGGGSEEEATETTETNRAAGICVPNFSPGLQFWEDSSARQICGIANAKCIVKFEKGLVGGEKCVDNCHCLDEDWAMQANQVCVALGDCGGYTNYVGDYEDDGYRWTEDGKEKTLSPNNVNIVRSGFSGYVMKEIYG